MERRCLRRVACVPPPHGKVFGGSSDTSRPIRVAEGLEQTDRRRKRSMTGPFGRSLGQCTGRASNSTTGETADHLPKGIPPSNSAPIGSQIQMGSIGAAALEPQMAGLDLDINRVHSY